MTVATAGSAPPLVDTSDFRHELGVAFLSVIVTSAALSFPPTCPSDVWNDAGRAMAADFSISVIANDQLLKSQLLLQEICGLGTDNGISRPEQCPSQAKTATHRPKAQGV